MRAGRRSALTLSLASKLLVLVASAAAFLSAGARSASQVVAQAGPVIPPNFAGQVMYPGNGCGSLAALQPGGAFGRGDHICFFDTGGVDGDLSNPGLITISVTRPQDVTIVTGYAADRTGNICEPVSGAGTATMVLSCPTGLHAYGTGSVTLRPDMANMSISYASSSMFQPGTSSSAPERLYFPGGGEEGSTGAIPVMFPAGWNLVGGPSGWNLQSGAGYLAAPGPYYTFQADDSTYDTVPASDPLPAGVGVWAYLGSPQKVTAVAGGFLSYVTLLLPAAHWILISNPAPQAASVSGADRVYAYDPGTDSYVQTKELQPLQGAWAYSFGGGTVTIDSDQPLSP